MNIVRELEDCALTFRREEVHLLVSQSAWQIGPLSDAASSRTWHEDLMTYQYGKLLLSAGHRMLQHIQENWLELVTLRTLGTCPTRIVESMSHELTLFPQSSWSFAYSTSHPWETTRFEKRVSLFCVLLAESDSSG
jgi:hypothetical protein